jgi:hypothetical protein
MTPDQQLDMEVAVLCGWTIFTDAEIEAGGWLYESPNHKPTDKLPRYGSDLNAMAEAEGTLTRDERELFHEVLVERCEEDEGNDLHWSGLPTHATAPQRRAAFLAVKRPQTTL